MNINFLKNNLIAHRGLHNKDIPENSIKAFTKAIEYNYIIELDVHLLNDGNVVVFHDDNLKRMTGIDKLIKDVTYDEIKNIKLLNSNECIPLLEEVIKLVGGKVPLLIEIKNDNRLLEDKIISLLNNYKGLYAIQSFKYKSFKNIKKKLNNVPIGILISKNINIISKFILNKYDFISINYKYLKNKNIQKFKNKKLILTWTIRNKGDLNKLMCDNFIIEYK